MATGPAAGSVKMEPGNSRLQQRRQQQQQPQGSAGPTLPTFIYEYLLKRKQWEVARHLLKSDLASEISHSRQAKSSSEANGVDEESDMSNKGEFPIPVNPNGEPLSEQNPPFLEDWWGLFWSIWNHSRSSNGAPDNPVGQLLAHQQAMQKRPGLPDNMLAQQNVMGPNGMMMNRMGNAGVPNGNIEMQRRATAMAINAQRGPNGMMRPGQMGAQQPMGPAQMQRDGSQLDANGQDRAGSPMSGGGDNQPSPKRPRIDGGFNGQGINQGPRNPGMPQMNGAPNGTPTMMPNGFDPSNGINQFGAMPGNSPMSFNNMNNMKRSMGDGAMAKNFMPPNQMGPGVMPNDMSRDFMNNGGQMRNPAGQGAPQNGGALADYQMQLMLLEQQNKKRLLMARQENDIVAQNNGQIMTPNGMPAGGPFPPGAQNGAFQGVPNGQMPGQQMDMSRGQGNPAGRPGGFGPGGMHQNMMPAQPGVEQRAIMPPPQAPGVANAQARPPGSPAQPANPPTPSQAKQPNPKTQNKKNARDNEGKGKKNQKKTTGATPQAENENNPPTPTPATPITPQHPQSFNKPGATSQGGPASAPNQNNVGGPIQAGAEMNQADPSSQQPFGNLGSGDMDQQGHNQFDFGDIPNFGMDGSMGNQDVLEGFDFGSFLNMEDDPNMGFDPNSYSLNEGVEMGTGQQ